MNTRFRPAKLLICVMGRHRGELLVSVAKAAGARGGTIAHARTIAGNRLVQALALGDVSQEVVFTLMGAESEAVISAIEKAASEEPKKLQGKAVLLDVTGVLIRKGSEEEGKAFNDLNARSESMEAGYQMITVIVNHGYADDVMAAARKAGARGGTILNARGTGTEADVKFFGISLVPEKEMLLVVAEKDHVEAILKAVGEVPNLSEPGGGIAYAMPVERFIRLGG